MKYTKEKLLRTTLAILEVSFETNTILNYNSFGGRSAFFVRTAAPFVHLYRFRYQAELKLAFALGK